MAKEWILTTRTESTVVNQLLKNRGIEDHQAFLEPNYRTLHDPHQLKNSDQLINRLIGAINSKEPIAIFGDYDHDGTPAAALLADGISHCGGQVALTYIPSREEGYSISLATVDSFAEQGIRLMILVDCGITNKPEVDYAKTKGIETLVIDHHHVQEDKYPDQAIVINPKQAGDNYPFKELCACGLAFKVIQLLAEATGKMTPGQLKWYLDLVAISTICDMVPLVDENRVLVHYGLIVLRQTRRLGLQALYRAAAIDPATITSYTVGFAIGPRLNAPGRMEKASIAYQLLDAQNEAEAATLAQRLNDLNKERQSELDRVLKEAEAAILADGLHQKKVILVAGDGWSDGVVGLVAGRMTDKYHRPALVLAGREDGLAKGSARSIDGFHLVEALNECQSYIMKYGGHAKAAGLTLAKDQLTVLYDKLIEIAEKRLTADHLRPRITLDSLLHHSEINQATVTELARLEPYGLGNPRPIFLVEKLLIQQVKTIGATNKHLKFSFLTDDSQRVDGVAFNLADRLLEVRAGQLIDVATFLDLNEWQGRQSAQLKIIDWRSSSSPSSNEDAQAAVQSSEQE